MVTIHITAFGVPSNWFYAAGGALTQRARAPHHFPLH